MYFSVGMIAMPIADIMRYKKAKQNNGDALFDYSGPVVEYVAVRIVPLCPD